MYDGYLHPKTRQEAFSRKYDEYATVTGKKQYSVMPVADSVPAEGFSIESIIEQDSKALLDKVVSTACSIVYRLRISSEINNSLDYSRVNLRNQLHELYGWHTGMNANVDRRRSMLIKEIQSIDRFKLEEKVNCWKDLSKPVGYFVDFFHQAHEVANDKKLLL